MWGMKMRIGLIGCGALAQYMLEHEDNYRYDIVSVFVRDAKKYETLAKKYDLQLHTDLDEFLQSNIDLVVELAGVPAAREHGVEVAKKKDLLIISIGAFADEAFAKEMEEAAHANGHRIYLPSGAIGGLDTVQNARDTGQLEEVMISTRKPAASLDEPDITEPKVVFDGVAKDAIELFPKNVNISIALSLAGLGIHQTRVRLVADPHVTTNEHEITVKGPFGSGTFQLSNAPLPTNPKSSFITAMSVIGTLERLDRTIQIGS